MSHSPGTRLGPYEILAHLGAGGMEEVKLTAQEPDVPEARRRRKVVRRYGAARSPASSRSRPPKRFQLELCGEPLLPARNASQRSGVESSPVRDAFSGTRSGPLRDPRAVRRWRNGRGLPGAGQEARPGRGGQGAAGVRRGRSGHARALRARGQGGRGAVASEHPRDLRFRDGRRRVLRRHGTPRGRDSARQDSRRARSRRSRPSTTRSRSRRVSPPRTRRASSTAT